LKCFLDLDGVLVDFVAGACRLHGIENPYLKEEMRGVWNFCTALSMTEEEFWRPLDRQFWSSLDKTHDSDRILSLVESKFERVCLLTSPSSSFDCPSGKSEWIHNNLPKYWRSRRYLLGSAKEFCASKDAVLVDDSDHNINKFRAEGGHGILVPRAWNSLHHIDGDLAYIEEELNKLS